MQQGTIIVSQYLPIMTITITKEAREQAVASLQRYFKEQMEEPIGNLMAGGLLDFFVTEVGPLIYNQAVADVQNHLQARLLDLEAEVYADTFPYWQAADRKKRGR